MQVLGKRATKTGPGIEILWAWHKDKKNNNNQNIT